MHHILSLCLPDARVTRLGQALVLLVNHGDAAVAGRIIIGNAPGTVGGAVVDQDDFVIGERLRQHTVDAPGQCGLGVIDGNDDRNGWHSELFVVLCKITIFA